MGEMSPVSDKVEKPVRFVDVQKKKKSVVSGKLFQQRVTGCESYDLDEIILVIQ